MHDAFFASIDLFKVDSDLLAGVQKNGASAADLFAIVFTVIWGKLDLWVLSLFFLKYCKHAQCRVLWIIIVYLGTCGWNFNPVECVTLP